MSRSVPRVLAFGLVALVWLSLAPPSSHGQISFVPPRGANAISPTMSTPKRPALQAPTVKAATTHQATTDQAIARQTPVNRHPSSTTLAVSSDVLYTADPLYTNEVVPALTRNIGDSAPYTSALYPAHLRSLNLREEESGPWFSHEAAHSAGTTTTQSTRLSSPSSMPEVADHIQVASYRVGQQR